MVDPTDETGTLVDWGESTTWLSDWIENTYVELTEVYNEIEAFVEEIVALFKVGVVHESIPWNSPDQANDFYCAAFNKWIDDQRKKERSPPRAIGKMFWNIIKKGNYWVAKN